MSLPRRDSLGISTLVFDLDGTISDPSRGICNSVNHALHALDREPADASAIRQMIGPPLEEMFAALVAELEQSELLALISAYRDYYGQQGYAQNLLYPEMAGVINELRLRGYQLGICTSKRADFAATILRLFDLNEQFAFLSGGDIGIRKADQLATLVGEGLVPQTAMMIGDREVDIQAARSNGLATLGVLWGFGSPGELAAASPDYLCTRPAELLEIFR